MLDEGKNVLDDIGEKLAELASQVTLQGRLRRAMEIRLSVLSKEKNSDCKNEDCCECRCPLEATENDFYKARILGRIEGKLLKVMQKEIFEYDEEDFHGFTQENVICEIRSLYEDLLEVALEFDNL
jgi:hypothetical protein